MSEKSIKSNYLFNAAYQVLTMIIPLITTPYVSRILGADGIGIYSYASAFVSYFSMFAIMGTSLYGQREISYNQNNIKKRSIIFWNIVIFRFFTTIITAVAYCVVIAISGYDIATYSIMLFSILVVALDISWFFQGMEEFKKIAVRDTIFKIFSVFLIFLFVKKKEDLILYLAITVGVTVVSALSFWFYVPRYIKKISPCKFTPFKDIKIILSLFIPTIAIQIYTVMDKTMIGIITANSYENGYYEQAIKISKMAVAVITALGTVMVPRIGFYFAQKKEKEVKQCMYRSYRFVWFLGTPMCLGLVGVADNMVPWFFGSGYEKVTVLLKILAFLILAIGISNVTGMQYLIPTKRQGLFTRTVVIGALVNLSLNTVLILVLESVGAALASIIAESIITIIQLVYVRKELEWKKIIKSGWKYYLSGIVMLLVLILEGKIFSSSIWNTFIMIITGGGIYIIGLIILKDEFFLSNLKNILARFCKKADET